MYYSTGHNIPGYLPEGDVWYTTSVNDAKMSVIDDLTSTAETFYELLTCGEPFDRDAIKRIIKAYEDEVHYLTNVEVGDEGWSWTGPMSDSPHDLGLAFWIEAHDGPLPEGEF